VELAFPWSVLSEHARHPGPPHEGEQWRINFSRVEWDITTTNGVYRKVPDRPEDNWVWSPQGVVDMHRPEMWGLLQFTRYPVSQEIEVTPIPGKPARDLALAVYYAQRKFWREHQRWATNLTELGAAIPRPPSGVGVAGLTMTTDGYACAVGFEDGGRRRVWRIRQDRLLKLDEPLPVETSRFIEQAAGQHGELGRRAAAFLVDHMPPHDRATLSCEFLMENLNLAFAARERFPWAQALSESLFVNDVLPYASIDEPRDPWRAELYPIASEIVRDCTTAAEAAQALNRDLFNRLNVHYNLRRKRNNQSPKESIEQGMATCTGLSILLVDACRAVGVPARIVGVPEWVHKQGNHTWVEIWDGEWFYTGADEYAAQGLNRAWFTKDAAQTARSPNALNQIYATSWQRTGSYFPLAWDFLSRQVPAVNVSARYAALAPPAKSAVPVVHLRLLDVSGGERVVASVELRSGDGELIGADHTRAGTADLNDMPGFTLPEHTTNLVFRFARGDEVREALVTRTSCIQTQTLEFAWDELTPVDHPAPGRAGGRGTE
jgi:hypothetical protein